MVGWFSRLFSSHTDAEKETSKTLRAEPSLTITPEPEPKAEPVVTTPPVVTDIKKSKVSSGMSWMQREGMNADFLSWLFNDYNKSELFANQLEKDILAALEKIATSKQKGTDLVRRMPGVVPQLLQSLRTDDFSGSELARKISHDVVLVAAVIRIANSSLYKSSESISSIEHAIIVLGQNGLRQLITSVAFKPIIDLKSGHFTKTIAPKIWSQSETCARATRMLAEGEALDTFDAFLAGLIQHVGLIVALRVIDQVSEGKQNVGSAEFCNALLVYGSQLSAGIAREWKFPDKVIAAIEEQNIRAAHANLSPIGNLLKTGDYLSKLQLLKQEGRLPTDTSHLLKDLSDKAISCLQELDETTIDDETS